MISSIPFGSCYVCSPGGVQPASKRSRLLRALLKAGDRDFLFKYAGRVRRQAAECDLFDEFFCEGVVLMPVPGSEPRNPGSPGVAERLARALVGQGLGARAWSGLSRSHAVRKSAAAAAGARPTAWDHYDSFVVDRLLPPPDRIVLVDDVVTKGRTLLAAAARVQEAYPATPIRAFALVRTMGLIPEIDRLLDPCVGEIRWRHGDAHRSP